ncbi:MAG TPA: hypothetical protein VHD56_09415 [Tepidisphaeraceae bacterium]|nr:hypothetical protein [Tepidisphaeraceae bacterium]
MRLKLAVFALLLLQGCISYKHPTSAFINHGQPTANESYRTIREVAAASPLYSAIPRDRKQIRWFDAPHWLAWTFFGNENDGIFGEELNPPYSNMPSFKSFLAWWTRNPMANFCLYVIGSGDWKTHHSFSILQSDSAGTRILKSEKSPSVFGTGSSAIIIAFNDFKPYLSFKFPLGKYHQTDFYLGWRPRGHFGLKFRPYLKTSK